VPKSAAYFPDVEEGIQSFRPKNDTNSPDFATITTFPPQHLKLNTF
jgi:hypothetical protein